MKEKLISIIAGDIDRDKYNTCMRDFLDSLKDSIEYEFEEYEITTVEVRSTMYTEIEALRCTDNDGWDLATAMAAVVVRFDNIDDFDYDDDEAKETIKLAFDMIQDKIPFKVLNFAVIDVPSYTANDDEE